MKTRQGFVSNSSSSSFVVTVKDFPFNIVGKKQLISDEDVETLLRYGFKWSHMCSPISIEENKDWEVDEPTDYLAISVICNQDIVIEFLTQENIPFKGIVHYGHESVFYKKDSPYVLQVRNLGLEYTMYDEFPDFTNLPNIITKIPIKQYTL